MDEHTTTVSEGLDRQEMGKSDMEVLPGPHLKSFDEQPERSPLEVHNHHHAHDHAHVDLRKEEYLPDEVADMLGTSLEVVMRAIRYGDLKAERKGQRVVCITRAALLDWYKTQG